MINLILPQAFLLQEGLSLGGFHPHVAFSRRIAVMAGTVAFFVPCLRPMLSLCVFPWLFARMLLVLAYLLSVIVCLYLVFCHNLLQCYVFVFYNHYVCCIV